MIGAGGLLYCIEKGIDVPGRLGLAGFNNIELLDGLPKRLATMDACRAEIGRKAAEIIARRAAEDEDSDLKGERIELSPTLNRGDTLRLRPSQGAYPEE
jgi:LacI family gluconate utilization system Gnt-I transcriptional repressor